MQFIYLDYIYRHGLSNHFYTVEKDFENERNFYMIYIQKLINEYFKSLLMNIS